MLEKKHRVVRADGGFQKTLGILRRPGRNHLQPGEMGKDGIRCLRMCGAQLAPSAGNRPDDHRQDELPAEHVMQLGGLIDNVVHGCEGKVDRH